MPIPSGNQSNREPDQKGVRAMELLLAIVTVGVAAFLSHLAVEFGLSSRAKTETGEVDLGK